MTLALGVSLWYGEADSDVFLLSTIVTLLAGILGLLIGRRAESRMGEREGYVIVAMVWVVFSAFGLLPYYLSGQVPSFTDAWFESMSGFTTTGATIIPDLEVITHGLLFWRSTTNWVGGIGVVIFAMMAAGGDLGASVAPQMVGALTDIIAADPGAVSFLFSGGTPEQIGMRFGMLVAAAFPLLGGVILLILRRYFKKKSL